MEKIIKKSSCPEHLDTHWDHLADVYFQKREFLHHLHTYNPCEQRYYELYCNGQLRAGTIVYTLKIDILTFANIPSPLKLNIIGLPVSVAAPPIIGDPGEYEYLLSEIINTEQGFILGINFMEDYLKHKVLNLRTLPTVLLKLPDENLESYENLLRHPYRRRVRRIRERFSGVTSVTTACADFSEAHYALYLQIMKKTTTRLEILSLDLFKNLPSSFHLTTYYKDHQMLCWHIICKDEKVLFFFFGGMNYLWRDQFRSYNNNLLGIISAAMDQKKETIDFGQTAEIAKMRLGGTLSERRMFLYHKNAAFFGLLKLIRSLISYNKTNERCHVFKVEN